MNILNQINQESKIVIYGAGIVAKSLILIFNQYPDVIKRVVGIAVTNTNYNETEIEGVPVCAAEDIFSKYTDVHVIIAVRKMYREAVLRTLEKLGIKKYSDIDMEDCIEELEKQWITKQTNGSMVSTILEHRGEITDEDYLMFLSKQLYNAKLDFEVNLVDHCNLNCQCCNHFSPLADKHFLDCLQYEKDIARIADITKGKVGTLMLLGGEPLLHPEIVRIMQISRQNLPKAEISIISNGLLLGKMEEVFWQNCREYDIHIVLTKYPIHFNYEELDAKAEAEGVSLSYTYSSQEVKTTYRLPLKEEGTLNACKNYMKCYHAKKCVVLRDGRIYTCPISAYVHIFNKYFDKKMPEGKVNSLDIYEELSMEQLQEFLGQPIPMCRHCDIFNYEYDIPWQTSKRELKEWTD